MTEPQRLQPKVFNWETANYLQGNYKQSTESESEILTKIKELSQSLTVILAMGGNDSLFCKYLLDEYQIPHIPVWIDFGIDSTDSFLREYSFHRFSYDTLQDCIQANAKVIEQAKTRFAGAFFQTRLLRHLVNRDFGVNTVILVGNDASLHHKRVRNQYAVNFTYTAEYFYEGQRCGIYSVLEKEYFGQQIFQLANKDIPLRDWFSAKKSYFQKRFPGMRFLDSKTEFLKEIPYSLRKDLELNAGVNVIHPHLDYAKYFTTQIFDAEKRYFTVDDPDLLRWYKNNPEAMKT